MTVALDRARKKYEQKRKIKSVSFLVDEDKEILEFANSINFSEEVKNWLSIKLEAEKLKSGDEN